MMRSRMRCRARRPRPLVSRGRRLLSSFRNSNSPYWQWLGLPKKSARDPGSIAVASSVERRRMIETRGATDLATAITSPTVCPRTGRIVHEFRHARLRLDSARLNSPEVADEPETKHRLDITETNELSDRDGRLAIRIHRHEELSRSWRVGHATLSGCEPGLHVFRGFGIGCGR